MINYLFGFLFVRLRRFCRFVGLGRCRSLTESAFLVGKVFACAHVFVLLDVGFLPLLGVPLVLELRDSARSEVEDIAFWQTGFVETLDHVLGEEQKLHS